MRFVSTRGGATAVTFSTAMEHGLAPDGGLYVPATIPTLDPDAVAQEPDLPRVAARVVRPFLDGDVLAAHVDRIVETALSFAVPLVHHADFSVLELFHGPTAAFKDVGARFMAACMSAVRTAAGDGSGPDDGATRTILVATSGDTGGAVAAAFHRRTGFRVTILFPEGGVSPRQRHQLTCFDDNVTALAVRGTFDDCQRMLKATLADPALVAKHRLTTANSINIARLLPQVTYYAAAAAAFARERGAAPTLVVPAGNLGNALAALWAKRMGMPIARIVVASNANRTVPDFLAGGPWSPRPSVRTLANAMDVGDPSNMERVFHLVPDHDALRREIDAVPVEDDTIRAVIADDASRTGRVWCPHTATAVHAVRALGLDDAIVVATAHPAKFDEVVAPLVGRDIQIPPALAALLKRPTHCRTIDADPAALARELDR